MSTPSQPSPHRGRALAAILAVAASVSLLVAQDQAPANSDSTVVPATTSVTTTGNGTAAPANGALSGNATQLTVETDLLQLQRFLSMPPERLKQLRDVLDKLDNMSLGERAAWSQEVNRRVQSIRDLSQEIRGDIRLLAKPEDRSILNRYMLTLYPEDIQPLLKSFQDAKDKPVVRQQIIQDMLKKAIAIGIKPDPNASEHDAPPGARGNRGRNANNGGNRGQNSGPPAPASIPPPSH